MKDEELSGLSARGQSEGNATTDNRRGNEVKLIVDAENLWQGMKTLFPGSEFWDLLEKMLNLLRQLKREWLVQEAVSFHTYISGEEISWYKKEAWNEFERAGIEVHPVEAEVSEEKDQAKSRVDPAVKVEILETIQDVRFGHILLLSGDGDYFLRIKEAQTNNLVVTVAALERQFAQNLRRQADWIVFLEEYLLL